MDINLQEKKYLTPYVAWLNIIGNNEGEVGRFMKHVAQLPVSIQGVLRNFSTAEFIEDNLGSNFNLNQKQKTEITRIISDVLMGDLFIGEMAQTIATKANLAPNEAKRAKDSIISILFKPATEDIKKLQAERFPEKINNPISEKPDLKIEPDINRNNIVDLRNK